ncbi:MAG: hypothetical protein NVSMB68_16540 [Thermoanaerobaculia bacterium]
MAALAALPVVIGSIPMSLFERMPKVCLLRRVGIPCWGCGMTRAVASAARADFRGSWRYNRLSVIVVPMLAFLWARRIAREIARG